MRQRALSVRHTEDLARRGGGEDPELASLEERLRQALGTRVQLVRGRRGGRITIHFYSDEELIALVERLAGP